MFGRKRNSKINLPRSSNGTVLDPESRLPLELKSHPGYYPGFHVLDQKNFWDGATRELVLNRVNKETPIRFFTAEEALTMEAVVSRILPQDDRTKATRVPILAGIDERLYFNKIEGYRYEDMPSDQEAYRLAAQAFEAMAQERYGQPFSTLRTIEQEQLLQSLHDNEPQAAQALWEKMSLKRFWSMLVSDCSAVYYAHPHAWDEIGFGGPAYPRGYMRLEEGEPESWEVKEQRYSWLAPDDTLSDQPQKVGDHERSLHSREGKR